MLAYGDWLAHFLIAPDKHELLVRKAVHQGARLAEYAVRAGSADCPPCVEPLVQDRRFRDDLWQRWPYNLVQPELPAQSSSGCMAPPPEFAGSRSITRTW